MKNTGMRAKLQGECAMLDREIRARKCKFGVDLYDLLLKQEKEVPSVKSIKGSFRSTIAEHWETVRNDMMDMERKKDAMEVERTHEEVSRERGAPAISAGEKVQKAGQFVTSTGKETRLMAQMVMVDRDMKKRKEQFGIDVFEDATAVLEGSEHSAGSSAGAGGAASAKKRTSFKKGFTNAIGKGLQKVSSHEKEILTCVELAARDVGNTTRSKDIRLREMEELN